MAGWSRRSYRVLCAVGVTLWGGGWSVGARLEIGGEGGIRSAGPARGGRVSVLDPSDDVLDASPPPRMPRALSSSAAEDDIRCFADALSCLTAPLRLLLAAAACLLSLLSLLLALLWCGLPGLCALRPFRRRAAQRRRGEAACTARGARRAARGAAGQLQGLRRARRQQAARAGGQRRGCAGGGVEPRPSGIAARLEQREQRVWASGSAKPVPRIRVPRG